jgi:uncharacterized protein (TIGR02266 family)
VYERSVLILDSPDSGLGDTAIGLIAMGVSAYYCNNLDDAVWLGTEHRARIGALAAPVTFLTARLDHIRKELLTQIGLPVACAIPVGAAPSETERKTLALAGVRWGAFEPCSPRELRFVLSLALSSSDRKEARREPRIPCELEVEVTTEGRSFLASLNDLSQSGAYIASRSPLKQGTPLRLAFTLDAARIELRAEVKWRTALDGGFAGWLEPGMGVEFVQPPYETRAVLRRHVAAVAQRFELSPQIALGSK